MFWGGKASTHNFIYCIIALSCNQSLQNKIEAPKLNALTSDQHKNHFFWHVKSTKKRVQALIILYHCIFPGTKQCSEAGSKIKLKQLKAQTTTTHNAKSKLFFSKPNTTHRIVIVKYNTDKINPAQSDHHTDRKRKKKEMRKREYHQKGQCWQEQEEERRR